jgi:hypothetical protein
MGRCVGVEPTVVQDHNLLPDRLAYTAVEDPEGLEPSLNRFKACCTAVMLGVYGGGEGTRTPSELRAKQSHILFATPPWRT